MVGRLLRTDTKGCAPSTSPPFEIDSGGEIQAKQNEVEGGKLVLEEGEYALPDAGLKIGSNIVIEGTGL